MTEPTFPPMVEAPAALATVDNACQWLGQHRSALLGALALATLLAIVRSRWVKLLSTRPSYG